MLFAIPEPFNRMTSWEVPSTKGPVEDICCRSNDAGGPNLVTSPDAGMFQSLMNSPLFHHSIRDDRR
jgi:hypothetical protein